MVCEYCEKNTGTVEVCTMAGEYEMWCEFCANGEAFYDPYSKEMVANGCQAVWRRGEDMSDSGLGDLEDVSPTWAEENLVYCHHCDCYVSHKDWNEDTQSCRWCATKATQRTKETWFEDVPLEYAEEHLAFCKKCNSYVASDKWNAKEEMCIWCAESLGR